ncbi:MAG: putative O-glycosylation ligase, exosortase A system-associated [Rhodospirillaceae bacterium]
MRDIVVTLIVFGAIPLVFMRPWTGILLFAWISYMNPHRLTYGFAFNFQFAMLAALATIIAFVIGKDSKKIPVTPITVTLFIFILWTSITTIFALAPENAMEQYTKFLKIQLMTVLTLAMINSRERITWLVIVIAFSLGFYGVRGGVFSILTGGNYQVWGPPGSFFQDNNQLALTLIMTMPLIHYLQLVCTKKLHRHALSVMLLLTLAAIIGTHSRGALLALCTMGFFLWLRSSRKLPVSIAAVIGVIGVLSFMPQHWFDRMDTINTYEEDESAMGRFDAWQFAINVANDRALGGGFKVNTSAELWPIYNPESPEVRAPHSIYFEVLGEHGWTGLSIFLLLGVTGFFTCSRIIGRARGRPDLKWASDLAKMIQVSLVGYASAGAFLNLATFDLYYHLLAIIVQTRLCVARAVAEGPPLAVRPVTGAEADPHAQGGDDAAVEEALPGPEETVEETGRQEGRETGGRLGGASGYLIRRR